ncbi:hypothetical protein SAMN04489712_13245 [Thermomonospora echinospora]|uniref:Uncharacterized protein n=1 Tax=Thermomonospora echinospora TaxID=1992 RepID=A0A1H6E3G0_9ACTN|nr:hypothetical protein [Thermomonospora echinospora]SEG92170.1 hypothetical protein SAMN04489712_13245 [Thermomonospora echinospora]
MSSTLLYLAIVAVWAVVLVPMWLRRDNDGFSRLLSKRSGSPEELDLEEDPALDDREPTAYDEPVEAPPTPPPPPRRRSSRAAVIARRRRRTFGLTLLLLASVTVVATGLAPWWAALPSVLLLAGHLSLLRVAAAMDTARRQAEAQARAAARRAAREAERPERPAKAEIIELVLPDEVFDQYADDRRAVGD